MAVMSIDKTEDSLSKVRTQKGTSDLKEEDMITERYGVDILLVRVYMYNCYRLKSQKKRFYRKPVYF